MSCNKIEDITSMENLINLNYLEISYCNKSRRYNID